MAERLKQLREAKGLSHDRLSKALKEQYGVSISTDSLQNYEVSRPDHSKAQKNQGMRVEYLRCLSDFYSVSTDYLLGLSDVKTPSADLQAVVSYTGLSEDNAATLHTHKFASAFDPPLIYNEARSVKGNELFLDCANDLLDAMYENVNTLLANYYLVRSLGSSIVQYDPDYYSETRERNLLAHGQTTMPTEKAAQLSCLEFGNVIERFLRRKYIVADCDKPVVPTQEGK